MPKSVENDVIEVKTKKNIVKKDKASETKKAVNKKTTTKDTKVTKITKAASKTTKVAKETTKTTAKATKTTKTTTKAATKVTAKTSKKPTTKKATTKKSTATKVENAIMKKFDFLQEYYDLPYRYNETIVTILAQTPKRLFVYWDISDKDREAYVKAFGDDFFEKTYPVLLVHNEDLNYTFEVPINDFANSWYLDIQDARTKYVVQLGRKFKNANQAKNADFNVVREEHINLQNDFIYITDSNELESPNDHILFELLSNTVKYRNVKTGNEYTKNIKDLTDDLNKTYPDEAVYELYTKLYENEIAKEDFGRKNPASGELAGLGLPTSSSSSSFRSSR